jgi:hypothetical protein
MECTASFKASLSEFRCVFTTPSFSIFVCLMTVGWPGSNGASPRMVRLWAHCVRPQPPEIARFTSARALGVVCAGRKERQLLRRKIGIAAEGRLGVPPEVVVPLTPALLTTRHCSRDSSTFRTGRF